MARPPIDIQFLWHFHQPYYSTPDRSANSLPWVRLHAIRAYYDMGRMLERHPEMRCVVNFSGSLLTQLREYLEVGKRDSWWYLTQKPAANLSEADRRHLLRHFFSIDWETSIRPLPRYSELLDRRGESTDEIDTDDFGVQDYRDLQVLFNLAWFGFSARSERAVVQSLLEKGRKYSEDEKQALLEQQIEVMQLLVPLYRRLHRRGQIELSVTPMYHPIMPLVIDSDSAGRATPDRPTPPRFQAREDAAEHLRRARTVALELMGVDVDGMWPTEGSVSPEALDVFDEGNVRWVASDEEVLAKSRGEAWQRGRDLYRPWRLEGRETAIFFRDRTISDQIGFVYGKGGGDPNDAVDDLIERVRAAGREQTRETGAGRPLVSIILDGENPWGHYPSHGEDFLDCLYGRLTRCEDLRCTTPGSYLDELEQGKRGGRSGDESAERDDGVGRLERLHSGSWIRGDYSIWIGHKETNRAWELLGKARRAVVEAEEAGDLSPQARKSAWEAIYIAEGSDWFWWFGEDFSSENDADFDLLFRDQLRYVYGRIGAEIPSELDVSIMTDRVPKVAFEAPRRLIQPRIDGRSDYYYEWSGSGVYRNTGAHGSMFENTRYVDEMRLGFDLEHLYARIVPGPDLLGELTGISFRLVVQSDERRHVVEVDLEDEVEATLRGTDLDGEVPLELVAFERAVELGVPFQLLGVHPGDGLGVRLSVWDERMEREQHPPHGTLELEVPDEAFEKRNWMV